MKEHEDGSTSFETQDYERAIPEGLTPKQVELLQLLYSCVNKSATAKQLAQLLNPNNPAFIIANRQVGMVGKTIAKYLGDYEVGIVYEDENGKTIGEDNGWFNVISDGYSTKTGWTLLPEVQAALENLNLVDSRNNQIEERLSTETQPFNEELFYKEGKVIQVFVNKYERNQRARIACIKAFGNKCYACGFDFEETYGDIAKGYIHIHHIKPLSDIKGEYQVDPLKDLIPLCPNCHSVVHLTKPELTIDDLMQRLKK